MKLRVGFGLVEWLVRVVFPDGSDDLVVEVGIGGGEELWSMAMNVAVSVSWRRKWIQGSSLL